MTTSPKRLANYTASLVGKIVLFGIMCIVFFCGAAAYAGTTSYQYDALGRVVKVTYPDTKQICYAYDAAGNRTQVKRQATGACTPPTSALTSSMTVETMFAANTATEVESVSVASESASSSEEQ